MPKSPGQCSTRLTTIGSAKTALMTATGTQTRGREKARQLARGPCCHTTVASTAARITGTKNRKQACPWIRNQPVSVKIHRSRDPPAATEAAATRNARYAGTYIQGIQSRLRIHGSVAIKPRSTARQTAAPRSDRVQPYTTPVTIATNALFSANTASTCAFHAAGTRCSA